MKHSYKKIMLIIIIILFLSSSVYFALSMINNAEKKNTESEAKNNLQIAESLLNQWENGIEKRNKDLYIRCFDKYMGNSISKSLEQNSNLPYYVTESIEIKSILELSKENLNGIYEIDIWPELGDIEKLDYHIYYFYFDAIVKDGKDSRSISTGENFYFCVVTKQEGEWRISQLSCAPEERFLIEKGINLGSNKEKSILENMSSQ